MSWHFLEPNAPAYRSLPAGVAERTGGRGQQAELKGWGEEQHSLGSLHSLDSHTAAPPPRYLAAILAQNRVAGALVCLAIFLKPFS